VRVDLHGGNWLGVRDDFRNWLMAEYCT
jgi:hypothetical protein